MISILIVDDQDLIAQSLKIVLENNKDFTVFNVAKNGLEAISMLKKSQPDVILMDIRMPKMDGVECTRIIKNSYPDIKIIILTTFDDDTYVYDALRYGASGYLLKGGSMDELFNAIKTVHEGQAMINPNIASKVVRLFSQLANSRSYIKINTETISLLTQNEWKVIHEIQKGSSNKEISDTLCLSEGTVRNYISVILDKLDLRDRTQLAIWAVQVSMGDFKN